MIKTKNKYRAFAYFATGTLYFVAFGFELLSGMIPRGSSDPAKFYVENQGFFWTYIAILFLLFLYQFFRGVYLYWQRLRRDTDPVPEKGSFSPRIASIITAGITIPVGLCFLILPVVELVKKTAYGGYAFGNHPLASDPVTFWLLLIVQAIIGVFPIICGILLLIFPPRHVDALPETEATSAQSASRPRMKTSTKVIIGSLLAVFTLGCIALAAIIGGAAYVYKKIDDPELVAKRKKATEEGVQFGKSTDQAGCMAKAFSLEMPTDSFDMSGSAFIKACLGASRKTPNFCEGVPLLLSRKWLDEECTKSGHETRACDAAFIEKLDYCRMGDEQPKN